VDLATVNLSCFVTATGETRFAYGAAAPVPFVVSDGSGLLADPAASQPAKDELLRSLTAHATPISDVRGGREYRQAMLLVMSRRALATALAGREGTR
jgi:CO/xanthine dehydrogenase FAD-binding subunit